MANEYGLGASRSDCWYGLAVLLAAGGEQLDPLIAMRAGDWSPAGGAPGGVGYAISQISDA